MVFVNARCQNKYSCPVWAGTWKIYSLEGAWSFQSNYLKTIEWMNEDALPPSRRWFSKKKRTPCCSIPRGRMKHEQKERKVSKLFLSFSLVSSFVCIDVLKILVECLLVIGVTFCTQLQAQVAFLGHPHSNNFINSFFVGPVAHLAPILGANIRYNFYFM